MRPVDVVVVSYNARAALLACCRSVRALPGARLIVVDNASTDGSADAVAALGADVTVLRRAHNEGFGAAANRGVAAGDAAEVLLLNSDATIDAAALEALRAALAHDPAAAAAGPRLRDANGRLELSIGRRLTPCNEAAFKLLEAGRRRCPPLERWLERRYGRPRAVASLSAACLLVRRAAFTGVGGFDERFFLYAEDVDLCLRLRRAGWRLLYVPEAEVRHLRGVSARSRPGAVDLAYRRSQLAFYDKHRGAAARLTLRAWLAARYALRWLRARGPGRRHAARVLLLLWGRP